jgi:hypothetical protein
MIAFRNRIKSVPEAISLTCASQPGNAGRHLDYARLRFGVLRFGFFGTTTGRGGEAALDLFFKPASV